MSSKNEMTKEAARRIQSHADRTGTNQGWKSRAMSAADRNGSSSSSNRNGGGNNDG